VNVAFAVLKNSTTLPTKTYSLPLL
jgi:hypothetical protein